MLNDIKRLESVENTMFKWICGVTLRDRVRSAELVDRLVETTQTSEICYLFELRLSEYYRIFHTLFLFF